eukprot:GFUD01079298.1.p1 GENE.GFUD01079298.1~~GFUD01079298.1.p1  ORF type:complete len:135 (-),score=40.23 GFUD01079298.1:183-587(-)
MDLQSRISKCVDPTSSLPTDVRFLFKVEGGNTKEIKAHKLILAIVHQSLSEALYDAVASFLMKRFNNMLDTAIDFFAETEATEVYSLVLMKMMARMKLQSNQKLPQSPNCKNCNQNFCLQNFCLQKLQSKLLPA